MNENMDLEIAREEREDAEYEVSEALTIAANAADVEEQVFDLLAGYRDKTGQIHKTFTVREIDGSDEEAIHTTTIKNNPGKVLSTLLTRCVTSIGTLTPKTEGPTRWSEIINNLYVGDQDYIAMQLRKVSVGETLTVNHECPACNSKIVTDIGIDSLEIIPFSGNYVIPFELSRGFKDGKGVIHKKGKIRLPRGIDRVAMLPVAKSNLARAETMMLSRLCSFDSGFIVNDSIMRSLTIRERDYLQKLLRDNLFGYKLEVEVQCPECGEMFTGAFNATKFI